MTSSQRDLLLDQAIDQLLSGQIGSQSQALEPGLAELLPLARDLRVALAEVPPPPHGLRPGRSAFLSAAATPAPHRWTLPNLGRALNWLAPIAAVLILAFALTFMLRNNVQPAAPSDPASTTIRQTQSTTPILLPDPTETATATVRPTDTPPPTATLTPTRTTTPTQTSTPPLTDTPTSTPLPTSTPSPAPTNTPSPEQAQDEAPHEPADTITPIPQAQSPTLTATLIPTSTPPPTDTPTPYPTATPPPATDTPTPPPTATPTSVINTPTATPERAIKTPTVTPEPTGKPRPWPTIPPNLTPEPPATPPPY